MTVTNDMLADALLDTIEAFVDINPVIGEDVMVSIGERLTGETAATRMMNVLIGEKRFLVIAKYVGE
jgi:hypothetical protein